MTGYSFDDWSMWKSLDAEMSLVWMALWKQLVHNSLNMRMTGRRLKLQGQILRESVNYNIFQLPGMSIRRFEAARWHNIQYKKCHLGTLWWWIVRKQNWKLIIGQIPDIFEHRKKTGWIDCREWWGKWKVGMKLAGIERDYR